MDKKEPSKTFYGTKKCFLSRKSLSFKDLKRKEKLFFRFYVLILFSPPPYRVDTMTHLWHRFPKTATTHIPPQPLFLMWQWRSSTERWVYVSSSWRRVEFYTSLEQENVTEVRLRDSHGWNTEGNTASTSFLALGMFACPLKPATTLSVSVLPTAPATPPANRQHQLPDLGDWVLSRWLQPPAFGSSS